MMMNWLGLHLGAIFMMVAPAVLAQSPREQFEHAVQELKGRPSDRALRERVIRLGADLRPAPALPEEALRFEGRAQFAFRNAKSEAEMLEAAREYLRAVEVAPWVAGYYNDLCVILEKANRLAEAVRACQHYIAGASEGQEVTDAKRRLAGLEFGLERQRKPAVSREACDSFGDMYRHSGVWARAGDRHVSVVLISFFQGGAWKHELGFFELTDGRAVYQTVPIQPVQKHFRVNDLDRGTPSYSLSIDRGNNIVFGLSASSRKEIVTTVDDLMRKRREMGQRCRLYLKGGEYYVELYQGGTPIPVDNSYMAGRLYFLADCRGEMKGDRPGWTPAAFVPHHTTRGLRPGEDSPASQGFQPVSQRNPCTAADRLGWLSAG